MILVKVFSMLAKETYCALDVNHQYVLQRELRMLLVNLVGELREDQ